MRIARIFTEKLFGYLNHDIPLHLDDRITIIHGPNGLGKTAILQLVNGLFNTGWSTLCHTPFAKFGVEFDDGTQLVATRKTAESNVVLNGPHGSPYALHIDDNEDRRWQREIQHMLPFLEPIDPDHWMDSSGTLVSNHEVQEIARERGLPIPPRSRERIPKWLTTLCDDVSVRLIPTQRLLGRTLDLPKRMRRAERISGLAVQRYANDLARRIQIELGDYARTSQNLERTFPQRLLQEPVVAGTRDQLAKRLAAVETRRKNLRLAGLGEGGQDTQVADVRNVTEDKLGFLTLFVGDVEQKLRVLEPLARLIELFLDLINRRFRHKTMTIDPAEGIQFKTDAGQILSPTKLSSGEQHELVLAYELLFHVRPDCLVLIDEPEISLHLSWQNEFLRDLKRIVDVSRFDVLLATHSPNIINDRWDLTVELSDRMPVEENGSIRVDVEAEAVVGTVP